jgi:uncharacterized protein YodC (DUF2158 family)
MPRKIEVEAGDVVMLRSGGPALTVTGIDGETVRCLWYADEAEVFRTADLPLVALTEIETDEDEEDEEDEQDDDDDENEDEE